jgi:uncharacterized membrane protein
MLAGVTHFTLKEEFENIYPARGAWGVWYLPGSKTFHVAWTGVAEFVGGLALALGGLNNLSPNLLPLPEKLFVGPVAADAALALVALVYAVTPANIYMFTHGARLPIKGPQVGGQFHLIRGIMQVVLVAMLSIVAQPTLEKMF